MFIRKNLKFDVTIFDASLLDEKEKGVIAKDILKYAETNASVFSSKEELDKNKYPRLILPIYTIDDGLVRTDHIALYHDILGIQRLSIGNSFGNSRIINKNFKPILESNKSRSKDNKNKVTTPDSNTLSLLKDHNPKIVNKFFKGSNTNQTDGYSYKLDPPIDEEREFAIQEIQSDGGLLSMIRKGVTIKEPFTLNSTTLLDNKSYNITKYDTLIFVDTICSISELHKFLIIYKNLLYNGNKITTNTNRIIKLLLNIQKKYNTYDSELFQTVNPNSYIYNNGLFSEKTVVSNLLFPFTKQDEKLLSDVSNIFIPISFIWLYKKGKSELFEKNTSIITEEHTLYDPLVFTYNSYCGFYFSEEKTTYNTTHDLTKSTGDLYTLKTKLTYIPSLFCSRLIKSKLKYVLSDVKEKVKLGNNEYFVSKSIVETDLLSSFHFINDEEKEKAIKNSTLKHYYICCDDRVELSYYANHVFKHVANGFSKRLYKDEISIIDLYTNLDLIKNYVNTEFIKDYKKLIKNQEETNILFNTDNLTFISKEMFYYEQSIYIYSYLLNQLGYFYNKPDSIPFNRNIHFLKPQSLMNWMDNINKYQRYFYVDSKVLIFKGLYNLISTEDNSILPNIADILSKVISEVKIECSTLAKVFTFEGKTNGLPTLNDLIQNKLAKMIKIYKYNQKLMSILSSLLTSDPKEVIIKVLIREKCRNFIVHLEALLRILIDMLYYTNIRINLNDLSDTDIMTKLLDVKSEEYVKFTNVKDELRYYNYQADVLLNKLKNIITIVFNKKQEEQPKTLGKFIDVIIELYTKDYISNINDPSCNLY